MPSSMKKGGGVRGKGKISYQETWKGNACRGGNHKESRPQLEKRGGKRAFLDRLPMNPEELRGGRKFDQTSVAEGGKKKRAGKKGTSSRNATEVTALRKKWRQTKAGGGHRPRSGQNEKRLPLRLPMASLWEKGGGGSCLNEPLNGLVRGRCHGGKKTCAKQKC